MSVVRKGMASPTPMPDLRDGIVELETGSGVQIDAGETETMADYSGFGIITGIWMAISFNLNYFDLILRVYVDGESTPAIQTDLGTLLACNFTAGGKYATRNVAVETRTTGQNLGFIFTFPMPFEDGCRVELFNPTGALAIIFWQVARSQETPEPYRLRAVNLPFSSAVTLGVNDTHTFFDISGDGYLVWNGLSIETGTPGNGSFVERDVAMFIDSQQYEWRSTSIEDWMGGSFSFQERQYVSSPFHMVGQNTSDFLTCAVDLAAWWKGIRFHERLRGFLHTTGSTTTAFDLGYNFLYYLRTS
jgi:Protein of unknown function (DUF2961)